MHTIATTFAAMHKTYFLALILVLAACKNQHDHSDKSIFRYNQSGGISSLDPAFSRDLSNIWACNQLYNGLLQMDTAMHIVPALAHDYSIDSTGQRYQFVLRNDVYFHKNACFGADSTRKMVASDVVFSLNRLRNPEVASPGSWVLQDVDSIWAAGDSVVHITLNTAFAPFLGVLTMKYCSIIPHEAIAYYGEQFSQNPVGTGPFTFIAWHRNEKMVFRKNPNYFERDKNGQPLPYLDGVSISFINDLQAAFLAFVKGDIDFISGIDASYKEEVITKTGQLKPKYATNYVLNKQPYLNTEYLIFTVDSAQKGLVHDKRLRWAINLGFDRNAMMAYLRNNIGRPADGGIVPYGLPGNRCGQGFEYQPDSAHSLIEELQEEYGELPEITLTTVSNYRDLCEFIQSEMAKLGLNIAVDVVPPANLREQKAQGNLAFFRASWIADYPDAENYLSLFYGPNRSPNGPNYSRFYNDTFDKIYEEMRICPEYETRISLCKKLDSIVVAEAPIVPLYYDEVSRIYPKSISGLKGNSLNLLDLRWVKK